MSVVFTYDDKTSLNFGKPGLCQQYLPRMVPLALGSCNLDDGTAVDFDDSSDDGENDAGGLGVLSSDDDDDADNKRLRNISVRTGVLDEKAAATQALGLFALHTKQAYMPYPFRLFSFCGIHAQHAEFLRMESSV